MRNKDLFKLFYSLCIISLLILSLIEGKGIGGSRGGGGFKGGSKGPGTFGGSSGYNRANSYGSNMGRPRSGGSFKSSALSFAAGAAGGVAAYSIMRSMSGSSHYRNHGYYGAGYGGGETCVNNEDLNGTVFGQFRCPLYGFPTEAKHCCGEPLQQYCCIRDGSSGRMRGSAHYAWIGIAILVLLIIIIIWAHRHRQRQKHSMMVPTEPPLNEQNGPPPFYHPPPPPMGYPPPPGGNPYAVPPQNLPGSFNPYIQQTHMPYPPQQQPYNPY